MGENQKTPIELVLDLLAVMTARATEAERQAAEARKSSDEWYQHWQSKDKQLKEAEEKLAAEIKEHQNTRQALREALATAEKGAQKNG